MNDTAAAPFLSPQAIARLGHLELIARTIVQGFIAGRHPGVHHGASIDFVQHREYVAGDELRRLDWRVWARRDRWYVREYNEETNMRILLVVDTSGSMGYGSAGLTKLRYAACLAAALAWLAHRQHDPVGLAAIGAGLETYLPPATGGPALHRVLAALEGLTPQGKTDLPAALETLAARVHRRGLIVLLSDLLADAAALSQGLGHFVARHHELLALQVLDPAERSFPFHGEIALADPESALTVPGPATALRAAYACEFAAWQRACGQQLARLRAHHETFTTSEPFELALGRCLAQRARR